MGMTMLALKQIRGLDESRNLEETLNDFKQQIEELKAKVKELEKGKDKPDKQTSND
jgi:cell division protein FtsB